MPLDPNELSTRLRQFMPPRVARWKADDVRGRRPFRRRLSVFQEGIARRYIGEEATPKTKVRRERPFEMVQRKPVPIRMRYRSRHRG